MSTSAVEGVLRVEFDGQVAEFTIGPAGKYAGKVNEPPSLLKKLGSWRSFGWSPGYVKKLRCLSLYN